MNRYVFGILAATLTGGTAAAQHHGGGGHAGGVHMSPAHHGGAMHFGGYQSPAHHVGGYHPTGNFHVIQAPPLYRSPSFGVGVGYGSGLYGGYGLGGVGYRSNYGGYGTGGFVSGGYSPYYNIPPQGYGGGGTVFVPVVPNPATATAVSGLLPATLIVQYPAAAKVWVDGVEVPGDPDVSWTLTSKDLRPGETATFRVRGRWEANGKTFEAVREVPLGPGARSRLVVVSGNEVKE